MSDQSVAALRYEHGELHERQDSLTVERPLQIRINGKPYSVTMRTPGDDTYLVMGLLFTEGVVNLADAHEGVLKEVCDGEGDTVAAVDITIPDVYLCDDVFEKRSLLASSSCGMCGQREFDESGLDDPPLKPGAPLQLGRIASMMKAMRAAQTTFTVTGSTHAAAVFDADYELMCTFEDIGRHNAVDKAVGFLLERDLLQRARVLTVSGRVSFEIINKAYRAGLPYVLAVSAPSSFAVDIAARWGMTVLGFCREERATIYSNRDNTQV
ncbi:MAG: formate dehydrogenase accessory sulfurtransferase FdhD [Lentisphaerae bacterium]|nr:formate dehydrogenase accessory sulfurtransferase FdhD [Lentisphaerota bacterium]